MNAPGSFGSVSLFDSMMASMSRSSSSLRVVCVVAYAHTRGVSQSQSGQVETPLPCHACMTDYTHEKTHSSACFQLRSAPDGPPLGEDIHLRCCCPRCRCCCCPRLPPAAPPGPAGSRKALQHEAVAAQATAAASPRRRRAPAAAPAADRGRAMVRGVPVGVLSSCTLGRSWGQ